MIQAILHPGFCLAAFAKELPHGNAAAPLLFHQRSCRMAMRQLLYYFTSSLFIRFIRMNFFLRRGGTNVQLLELVSRDL